MARYPAMAGWRPNRKLVFFIYRLNITSKLGAVKFQIENNISGRFSIQKYPVLVFMVAKW
jgi:hypothetical protein